MVHQAFAWSKKLPLKNSQKKYVIQGWKAMMPRAFLGEPKTRAEPKRGHV